VGNAASQHAKLKKTDASPERLTSSKGRLGNRASSHQKLKNKLAEETTPPPGV
jgi:hypothetical protein